MGIHVDRRTVHLTQRPNLVVIYLGMPVNRVTGLKTPFGPAQLCLPGLSNRGSIHFDIR